MKEHPPQKNIVELQNISLDYKAFEKAEGFFGTIKDFFNRNHKLVPALQDVSFCIASGEIVGLLGPNGAGKTSLLKILSGLIHPTSGSAKILEYSPYKKEKSFLKQIGMVMGQKSQLLWDLPPKDTFKILKELYSIDNSRFCWTLDECVTLLNVQHKLNTPIRHLSLGERMKFEIIASLLHEPQLLFLDEPTIGLDILSQKAIRDFLLKINQEKHVTIVITSHYLKDLEILADRLLILKKGRITFDGSQKDLEATFQQTQKIIFQTNQPEINIAYSIQKIAENEFSVHFSPDETQAVLNAIVKNISVTQLRTEDLSLEEMICNLFVEDSLK